MTGPVSGRIVQLGAKVSGFLMRWYCRLGARRVELHYVSSSIKYIQMDLCAASSQHVVRL